MAYTSTVKGLIKRFNKAPKEVQEYFRHLPKLLDEFPWEVSLSYLFSRVERAHNMTLYCGVMKLHQAHKDVVSSVIQAQHLTRLGFAQLFETVIGRKIGNNITVKIKEAEKVRDRVVHGKKVKPADGRKAIACVLDYAELLNNFLKLNAGFQPFADLRGFKGAAKSLPKSTTRWIMKGMGFQMS